MGLASQAQTPAHTPQPPAHPLVPLCILCNSRVVGWAIKRPGKMRENVRGRRRLVFGRGRRQMMDEQVRRGNPSSLWRLPSLPSTASPFPHPHTHRRGQQIHSRGRPGSRHRPHHPATACTGTCAAPTRPAPRAAHGRPAHVAAIDACDRSANTTAAVAAAVSAVIGGTVAPPQPPTSSQQRDRDRCGGCGGRRRPRRLALRGRRHPGRERQSQSAWSAHRPL